MNSTSFTPAPNGSYFPTPPTHPPDSSSSSSTFYQTFPLPNRGRELEFATANFLKLIKNTYQSAMDYCWPGYSSSLDKALTDKQKARLQKNIQNNLLKAINRTAEIADQKWCQKTKRQLEGEIKNYLKHPSMSEEARKEEKERIDRYLKDTLSPGAYGELTQKRSSPLYKKSKEEEQTDPSHEKKDNERQADDSSKKTKSEARINFSQEKRNIEQQTNATLELKEEAIDPNATAPYDQFKVCSSGGQVTIVGATTNTTNTTHANEQRVRFLNQKGDTIQVLDAESEAASAQFLPRQGVNNLEITCDQAITDVITEDPAQGYFHTRFVNQTISQLQYLVKGYNLTTRPPSSTAWGIARLLNNVSVMTPTSGSSYYAFYTTLANTFAPTGPNLYTFSTGQPTLQRPLSFTDGSYSIFQDWGQVNKFAARLFNQFRTLTGTTSIDLNPYLNQTINGLIKTLPIGPKTPLPNNGQSILLIVPVDKGGGEETTVLLQYLPNQQTILSVRELPPSSGLLNGKMSIAICPDRLNTFIYARDEAMITGSNQTQYAIRFNIFNVSSNGIYSLTGDQVYSSSSDQPPQSEAACFPNGKGAIFHLKNGHPFVLSFDYLNRTNAPFPSPAPVASPSSSPFSPSTDLSILITLPINLGETPIPITSNIITIGKDIEVIKVVNLNGYEFFYPNGSLVTIGTILSRDELYNLTLSLGNATQGSAPELEGCDEQGNCQPSTAGGYNTVFTGKGSNILLISLTTVGVMLTAIISTTIVYCNCLNKIAPYRNRKKVKTNELEIEKASPKEGDSGPPYHKFNS